MNNKFSIYKMLPLFIVLLTLIGTVTGCTRPTVEVSEAMISETETETESETEAPSSEPVTEPSTEPATEEPQTESIPEETIHEELVPDIPLYNQLEYNCPFGYTRLWNGDMPTVKNSGCGITSLAMVASYLLDDPSVTPDILAEQFWNYNTECGASWTLFTDSDDILGIGEVIQVMNWEDGVEEALRSGHPVISNQGPGIFTNSGHYIVLTGMTEDGRVLVNDPNGANYLRLADSFENGFKKEHITWHSRAYWIYPTKDEINNED